MDEDDDDEDDDVKTHRKWSLFCSVWRQVTDAISGKALGASQCTSHTESWVGKGRVVEEDEDEEDEG